MTGIGGTTVHGRSKHNLTVFGSKNGNYVGNGTVNRAVPHGCGVKPKLVVLIDQAPYAIVLLIKDAVVLYCDDSGGQTWPVTVMDSTNFYVGNASQWNVSMNANGNTYFWVAIV